MGRRVERVADGAPELDLLLAEAAEARALVEMARLRLQTARLRAAGPWAAGGERRVLLRQHFQRLALRAEATDRGDGSRT